MVIYHSNNIVTALTVDKYIIAWINLILKMSTNDKIHKIHHEKKDAVHSYQKDGVHSYQNAQLPN
jgi:hypothetical protein